MKRRKFIKRAGLAAAASAAFPYIIPSGRAFARTNSRMANHVVLVMFAGGVRQQESVLQRYLDDAQDFPSEGNIMYNMFDGAAPTIKIAYGTHGDWNGSDPIPQILGSTIEAQGTTFRELRSSSPGHYAGLNALISGNTAFSQGLRQKPVFPTIMESARRHLGLSATQAWYTGHSIGNSIPLLNYSRHPDYGADYGANFFAPTITFGEDGFTYLADAKIYHPEEELQPIYQMKYFLDNVYANVGRGAVDITNTEEEKQSIKEFMEEMYIKTAANQIAYPPVVDGNDLATIGYGCEVLKWFKPAITVISVSGVDGCHSNFTGYLQSLHRADHAVGHLWNFIQNEIPEMANNTVMILSPECGRNAEDNGLLDENDWNGFDHSDENTARVFGQMVGPGVPAGLSIGGPNNSIGGTVDVAPTIAEILGFKPDIMGSGLLAPDALSWFDRI
jgi:hypothetical protein